MYNLIIYIYIYIHINCGFQTINNWFKTCSNESQRNQRSLGFIWSIFLHPCFRSGIRCWLRHTTCQAASQWWRSWRIAQAQATIHVDFFQSLIEWSRPKSLHSCNVQDRMKRPRGVPSGIMRWFCYKLDEQSEFFPSLGQSARIRKKRIHHVLKINFPLLRRPDAASGKGVLRSHSSVSLGGIMDVSNKRQKRVKILTPEQKDAIRNLTDSNQIPHRERKRHWNALYRRLEHKDLPEGLLQKWQSTSTDRGKCHTQSVCFHMILLPILSFSVGLWFMRVLSNPKSMRHGSNSWNASC